MEMIKFLKKNDIEYKIDIRKSQLTGMNVEGILPLIAYPNTQEKLVLLINEIWSRELTYDVLGCLSNTYLCNSYSRDVVIITTRMQNITYNKSSIIVDTGYNLTKLSKEISSQGISGYEGFIGIPGTIGAAAINNSGAFNSSMHKVVISVNLLDYNNKVITLNNKELKYTQRNSCLKGKHHYVILSIELDITNKKEQKEIDQKIKDNTTIRQNVIDGKRKSLGTVFVASTMNELRSRHKFPLFVKKIIYSPFRLFKNNQKINKYLDFLFLGHPELSKHCDRLNRFAWNKNTKESNFFYYIETMQKLAENKLKLEIEIRK